MSFQNQSLRDGETASYTGESQNQAETHEVQVEGPRVTRSSLRGRRGNSRGRAGGRVGRPRNPTPSVVPTANLTEELSRILMSTLPTVLGQLENNRRVEEEERIARDAKSFV